MFETVDEIIDALGGTNKVAEARGLTPSTVSSWKARRSIPAERWLDLAQLARDLGVSGITVESLAVLHARRPAEAAEVRA